MRTHPLFVWAFVCPLVARAQDADVFRGRTEEPRGRSGVLLSLSALVAPHGVAGIGTLSVPLDRVVKGAAQMHATFAYLPATADVARQAVSAAWRVAGLGETDAALDAMALRARWSAVLPEARVRVLRHATDTTHSITDGSTDLPYSGYDSNSVWLEGRLTWRLDRLIFADEEPTIERLRLERQETRMKVAARVVDHLSKWQRAHVELARAEDGMERVDAMLREVEAASALDVMTAGWFTRWQNGGENKEEK